MAVEGRIWNQFEIPQARVDEMIDQCLTRARVMDTGKAKESFLTGMIQGFFKTRVIDQAVQRVQSNPDVLEASYILSLIARVCIEKNAPEKARDIANKILNINFKSQSLKEVSEAFLARREWDHAMDTALEIPMKPLKSWAIKAIVIAKKQSLRLAQGMEQARSHSDAQKRCSAMRAVIQDCMQNPGSPPGSPELKDLLVFTKTLSPGMEQSGTWRMVLDTYLKNKEWDKAVEMSKSVTDKLEQTWLFELIVDACIKSKDWEKAKEIIGIIRDENVQSRALQKIANRQAVDDLARSFLKNKEWDKAVEMSKSVTDKLEQTCLLESIVDACIESKDWEKAKEVTKIIPDVNVRSRAEKKITDRLAAIDLARSLNVALAPN